MTLKTTGNNISTAQVFEQNYLQPYLRLSLNDLSLSEVAIEQLMLFCETNFPSTLILKNRSESDLEKASNISQIRTVFTLMLMDASTHFVSTKVAKSILNMADSANRALLLVQLHKYMEQWDWLTCFMQYWICCDGCTLYADEFREIFKEIDLYRVREKFYSPAQKEIHESLSDSVRVYRGQWGNTPTDGLSWSLDIDVARKFAKLGFEYLNNNLTAARFSANMLGSEWEKLHSIKMANQSSVLLSAEIKMDDVILFNQLGEAEIFAPYFDLSEALPIEQFM